LSRQQADSRPHGSDLGDALNRAVDTTKVAANALVAAATAPAAAADLPATATAVSAAAPTTASATAAPHNAATLTY
jgi:hypothetical protein